MLRAVGKALGNVVKHKKMAAFNAGLSAWAGIDSYQTAREEGGSKLGAAAGAVVDAALPFVLGAPAYAAYFAATELPELAVTASDAMGTYQRNMAKASSNRAFVNAHFDDTQQAFTMRQAGMAIAQRSKYNMQQAMMGNEARYMRK
jgi:Sec-independent protein translocase protein TatA